MKIFFGAIAAFFLVSLSGCKLDWSVSDDESKEQAMSEQQSSTLATKQSIDDSIEITKSQPLAAVQTPAWYNFFLYSTGQDLQTYAQKIDLKNRHVDALVYVNERETIEPLIGSELNPIFFSGADREPDPSLAWQKHTTDSLKQARSDLNEWRAAVVAPRTLPASVELWRQRYRAVLAVQATFENGGNFRSLDEQGQIREVWRAVLNIETANAILSLVLSDGEKNQSPNPNFLLIRNSLLDSFLRIRLIDFQDQAKQLSNFYRTVDKKVAVILNNDKGVQLGSDTYVNEAGKTDSWKQIRGGAIFYSSNHVNGREIAMTAKTSKSSSSELAQDMKISSELRESLGSKSTREASINTPTTQ